MSLKKLTAVLSILGLVLIVLTSPVHALKPQGTCPNSDEIDTAIGCISTNASNGGFIKSILAVTIGLSGAIALILMLYGTFIITTSAGIPDKLNQGKDIINSAITGLVFIILSVILLQLIGVNLIGLPGL
jgi:hypothetical protein